MSSRDLAHEATGLVEDFDRALCVVAVGDHRRERSLGFVTARVERTATLQAASDPFGAFTQRPAPIDDCPRPERY